MHCNICGFAVPVSAATCTGCGSPIGARPQPAATYQMAGVMSLEFLDFIPHVFFWIALAAWLATFTGMVRNLVGD